MTKEECALLRFFISFSVVPVQKREDLCWRQTSAAVNISPLFICYFWSSHKPPKKKASTYGSTRALLLLFSAASRPEILLWFLLIPWQVGSWWVMCLWWGLWTNALRRPSINSSVALICSGSARGRATHVSRSPILCVFSSALSLPVRPSVFPCVACDTRYLSPSNIYQLSIVHLRSVYISAICMRPEITSVMASHSTEISPDVGNLSAWESLPQCTAAHLQSTASFGSGGCDGHPAEPELLILDSSCRNANCSFQLWCSLNAVFAQRR